MIQSLLLSPSGLERVSDWVAAHDSYMRIIHVLYEPDWDSYAVLVHCDERDATYLSLLEH